MSYTFVERSFNRFNLLIIISFAFDYFINTLPCFLYVRQVLLKVRIVVIHFTSSSYTQDFVSVVFIFVLISGEK